MKHVYQANDGKVFQTKDECLDYETDKDISEKLEDLVSSYSFSHGQTIINFITSNKDELRKILCVDKLEDGEWISNENNFNNYPPIPGETMIEVEYRNGELRKNTADTWNAAWRSIDNHDFDIMNYRILKDSE